MIKIASHPIWQVGFRPLFALTCISGAALPILWILIYSSTSILPMSLFEPVVPPIRWHAHEMFYGFGWALLGGFLLTASKNWVGIRGRHGWFLIALTMLWIFDRIIFAFGFGWPPVAIYICSSLFLFAIVIALEIDLITHHSQDSYADNYYLILSLPLFLVAKLAMMVDSIDPVIGNSMTIALFRLMFLIMLERTIPAFMKGAFSLDLKQPLWCKHAIKLLGFLLVFTHWLPTLLVSGLCILLSLLLVGRFFSWFPEKAFGRIDIGVMYLGYLAIVANLLLIATSPLLGHWVGTASTHIFTLGAIGLIAPAMIIRISKGHTGRKVHFNYWDKCALYLMIGALFLRVIVPYFIPSAYITELTLTALCWLFAFGIIGYRYIPMLVEPRIDGRLH